MTESTQRCGGDRNRWWAGLLAVLLVAAIPRLTEIRREFGRNADGTGTLYAIAARNYLLRDNAPTLWMPVISVGTPASPPTVYAHHPPSVPLLMALSVATFGDTVWAHRLPAALFTVLASGMVYGLLTRRASPDTPLNTPQLSGAIFGSLAFALSPMALRFGQMPDVVNSQLVFTCLLATACHLRHTDRPNPWTGAAVVASMAAAAVSDWPAFFLFLAMFVHALIRRRFAAALQIAVAAIGLFAALVAWISAAQGDWGLILHKLAHRSLGSTTDTAVPFTWANWLGFAVHISRDLHGWVPSAFGVAGIVLSVASRGSPVRPAVLLIAAWATLHLLVGRQASYNHDWWWWPLTAALSLGIGHAVARLRHPAWMALAGVVLGVAVAASLAREYRHLRSDFWRDGAESNYSLAELAAVVQRHTPRHRGVMLFQDDPQPYVHYRLDRPVIQPVWDAATFEARRQSDRADLFYKFDQALPAPSAPATVVIPTVYADKAADLIAHLRSRYVEVADGKFLVFLLDPPLPAPPAHR